MHSIDPKAGRPSAKTAALRLLSRRSHSEAELYNKLAHRGYDPQAIKAVLAECRRYGYLNDEALARHQISLLKEKGYGLYRVRLYLINKGFSDSLVRELLVDTYPPQEEIRNAQKSMMRKYGAMYNRLKDPGSIAKAVRFLQNRGYSAETVSSMLNLMSRNMPFGAP